MKKERILLTFLILTILLTIAIGFAAEDEAVEKGYSCLKNQLKDSCGDTKNIEQASFSLLAMSYDSKYQNDCKALIKTKKKESCWGETDSSSCNLRSTAIAILALKNVGENVDDSIKWILDKKETKTGLTWFLEIDSSNTTECDINGRKIIINENKKLSGSDPAGLIKSYNNYWFEITNINKNFTISCDKDFISTLLYKKPGSSVIHVSSQTHFTTAHDSTTEKVESYCFGTPSSCDYEGSLWSALALAKQGEDVSPYIPYLSAMSEEAVNQKYLPSAFLYMLTNAEEYSSELIKQQEQGKYWDKSNRRLYDTSIALLALQGFDSQEADSAKEYLLSVQEKSGDKVGCWNDNTALILYSAWPKEASKSTTGIASTDCETFGHYCVSSMQCTIENKLDNFYCKSLSDICCKTSAPAEQSCAEKNGFICKQDEKCTGNEIQSSDTNYCCIGACEKIQTENECQQLTFTCKPSCSDAEEEKIGYSSSCEFGQKCCGTKPTKGMNRWLIILLIILIILVFLAIIFRNQLRIWLFKKKSGYGYGKAPPPGSRPMPPGGIRPIFPPRPSPTHMYAAARPGMQARRPPVGRQERDKDFDETMRKLKEMSK